MNSPNGALSTTRQCQYSTDRGILCKNWTNVGEQYCHAHGYQIKEVERMWVEATKEKS